MFLRPRFGRNCLTRDPSGVLARDARCRLLIFRSAGDHWQVDLQITPNRRSWLLLTNRKWQLCRLAIWIPSTVSDHKHPSQAGKGFCASRQPGPRTGYCWKSVTTERTGLMPSRLFPSARHNCSREADRRRRMEGADIRGGQECKSACNSHSLFPGVGEGCGGDAHGRAEDLAQRLVAFGERGS